MPQLLVRDIESAVLKKLRSRAATQGVSVEEAHRRVLRQALLGRQAPARRNFIEYLQAMPDVELPLVRSRGLPRKVVL